MFVIERTCPTCCVRNTVNMSDGRPLCVNCTIRRVSGPWSRASARAQMTTTPTVAEVGGAAEPEMDPPELDPGRLAFVRHLLETGRIGR